MVYRLTISSRRRHALALLSALLCLAGCSSEPRQSGDAARLEETIPSVTRMATSVGPFLYVAGSKLSMYSLESSKRLHSTAVNSYVSQASIALDGHGDLCESNGDISNQEIFAYDAGTLSLVGALYGQGSGPALVADRSGYLYHATNGFGIYVYAPGCTHFLHMIRHCAGVSESLVFDGSGNLYEGDAGRTVCEFAPRKTPGHMKIVRVIHDGIHYPRVLAIGPAEELYVGNAA